jgi:hypothetical protein
MPEDDREKLPSPAGDGSTASADATREGVSAAEVQALVDTRLDDAIERLRERNKTYLQTLAARGARGWKSLAILLFVLGAAGWVFTLYQVFIKEPEQAREWMRQELGETMGEGGLREVVKQTVRSTVAEFVEEQLAPLDERTTQLENRIEDAVTRLMEAPGHASAARWNLSGRYVTDKLSAPGPAFGWLDGHGEILQGGRVRVSCASADISHFREVIAKFPYFPFPYWALAVCLKEKGDESWVEYAETGRAHELQVLQVPSHHESHDLILAKFDEMLRDRKPPPARSGEKADSTP